MTGILDKDRPDVIQLRPMEYSWAYDLYLKGQANNWVPTEVQMQKDIEQWKSKNLLSDNERHLIKRVLGFFSIGESLVSNNIVLSFYKYITAPTLRIYLLRQAWEEALHVQTVVYCCDSLNLDPSEVYEAYKKVPSIKKKDDFLLEITSDINRPNFRIETDRGKREFLKNILTYYIITEGTFFYSGFAMLLSFGRQNKIPGICEQIQYTLRDESLHIEFGTKLINIIKKEYPKVWTREFEEEFIEHYKKAVDLEIKYAEDLLPNGILGLNSKMFVDYVKHIANRRLCNIGVNYQFKTKGNPFPWMSEAIDLSKMKNFFERKVTEYQSAGSLIDMDF